MENQNERQQSPELSTSPEPESLWGEHYNKLADKLEEWGLVGELKGKPVPLDVWAGLIQPVADLSGYRIVLQAQNREPNPALDEIPLYVDVAIATPTLFIKLAKVAVSSPRDVKEWSAAVPDGVPPPRSFRKEAKKR